jgi:histidinol-phosphate aminotransferase
LALDAVSPSAADEAKRRAGRIVAERGRVAEALRGLDGVRAVYASDANYLLVRFADAEAAMQALLAAGVVVRDQRAAPQLKDALRITIGTAEENDAMLAALASLPARVAATA